MDPNQLGLDLLKALEARGWTIQRSTSREPLLPPDVRQRYPRVPGVLTDFLEKIDSCVNANENVWFISREDYRRTDDQGFRWNEFELMTREAGNAEWDAEARKFWDLHFPFMMAVHSDYDFLAVSLDERSYGQIVHGCGPTFEEASPVAPSFADFLASYIEAAAGRRDDYPFNVFV